MALMFACSNVSYATQIQETSNDVENISIIGTRLGTTQIGALSVLSRSEIEQINSAATIDLLRRIPHLDIAKNGSAGGVNAIYGGEAISGVINIVTRDRTDPVFVVEMGNHRQFNTSSLLFDASLQ